MVFSCFNTVDDDQQMENGVNTFIESFIKASS